MLRNRYSQLSTAAVALGLVVLTGCATNGFVRKEVAGAKSYSDTQYADAKSRADAAMDKATLAERLASGQIEYTEVATHQVNFAFDDYRLETDAQAMLDQMGSELSAHPGYVLEIRGFADAKGTDRYNYKLGRERAESVLRYVMTKHFVPSNRVAVVSFGEESPVADNESEEGRAQNRRVQVRLLEIKAPTSPMSVAP
jgi:outer membrane protein OmpA-like peptidoglycan-associated protein